MGQTDKLRALLAEEGALVLPGCFDALTARLIERAGYSGAFMGGFAVSASRLGAPDTGLISYSEMLDQGRNICSAVDFPVIGDGDTGYGNAVNVQRTVKGYADAGFACVMIEDQVSPKKCGHTQGKQIVSRDEAFSRIQAAVDAREAGANILIMARTDANATDGMDEAILRARTFADIGADITFLEAPNTIEEMTAYCDGVPGPKMANMVEGGETPFLPPEQLAEIGYKVIIYPISLMLAGLQVMEDALASIKGGSHPDNLAGFGHLRDVVGFPEYYDVEKQYTTD
ncbi:MAG TPA: isocitrate lyase/PEP mutase family protein [Rhodospirillales bacterium]|jgi:2-methylisocitrate lyase-like PEP mutase family enzyme|nr:MAG: 2,3-dimethylmalate lyase [Alphaproteobacteria bacterium MarineAlpha3_Bin1]PPR73358.1 MAG: 2,3-dimethylmalate lyase [Alphaproteobacteria bacterium MarineAlpha3_Bin2]HIC29524.1 isocitrate lyase/PEP mutase family protein [Rhodospirillales bacterium]HIN22192.1 isocitrate lyase/PEP mutase family protein [Rhodospirillales bacterium]